MKLLSILDSTTFVKTNVLGTQCLLDTARHAAVKGFVPVSTDEVYGSASPGAKFIERSLLAPNNPYAANKAGAGLLAHAYFRTYRFPVIITRCTSNYRPYTILVRSSPTRGRGGYNCSGMRTGGGKQRCPRGFLWY
jgi:dTDP-glucose 4,6-dehydratase